MGEIRFVLFPVPGYEVLSFQNRLVYSHIACFLVAPGGRCIECDLSACYSYCLVHNSLIFPYHDYVPRVEIGNHDALVRHFEARRSYFASLWVGDGVFAAGLDQLLKYICRRHFPGWVSHYSICGALRYVAPNDPHFPRSHRPLRSHYSVRKRTCQYFHR